MHVCNWEKSLYCRYFCNYIHIYVEQFFHFYEYEWKNIYFMLFWIKYGRLKNIADIILIFKIVFIFAVHLSSSNIKIFLKLYIEHFFHFYEYRWKNIYILFIQIYILFVKKKYILFVKKKYLLFVKKYIFIYAVCGYSGRGCRCPFRDIVWSEQLNRTKFKK